MNCISLENLSLGYGNKIIIKNLNVSFNNGEYIYVIGENGVGKSTLIKSLMGLLKPIEGRIVFDKNIESIDIGYLPQLGTYMKNFPASVREIVLSGRLNNKLFAFGYSDEDEKIVISVLDKLNILNLQNRSFSELSGGQQRRVLLARAMVSSNKVLVLDEPTAGLDPKASKNFYELLNKLNKELKYTIIMVSHDMKAAVKYADKVLHLHDIGYCFGNVEEYKNNIISEYFLEEGE